MEDQSNHQDVAKWICESGGTVSGQAGAKTVTFTTPDAIPADGFVVTLVNATAAIGIDDKTLVRIAELGKLETLILTKQPITGEGLKHVARLKKLTTLGLANTKIQDADLANLEELAIEKLDLRNTAITERAIEHLKKLPSLTDVWVTQGKWSAKAIEEFKKCAVWN